MASQQCPACQTPTPPVLLESSSRHATLNHCRCEPCAHVWTTPKDGTAVLRHVTPLTNSCPACQTFTAPVVIRDARYRCDRCAHVWTMKKDGTATVRHVTVSHTQPKLALEFSRRCTARRL